MADNIVGTAFVRIRALTAGVKRDIERGISKGVKDAERQNQRSGEEIGDDLGDGISKKLRSSQFGKMLGKSLQDSLKYSQAVARGEGHKVGDNIHSQIREALKPTIMGRTLGKQIQDSLKAAQAQARQAAQQTAEHVGNPFKEMLKPTILGRTMTLQLQDSLRRARAADAEAHRLGLRLGNRVGDSFAGAVGGVRVYQAVKVAIGALLLPALAGLLQIAGGYVGNIISLFSSITPALTGASGVALGALSALAQGLTVLGIAFIREGEALEEWKQGMTELFSDLAEEVQSAMLGRIAGSIRTFASVYLPILENGLLNTADAIGDVTDYFAALMNQPFFQGQFATLMQSNTEVIRNFGFAAVDLTGFLLTLAAAASPLTEMFAAYAAETVRGWQESIRFAQESGNLAASLDRAGQVLRQLGQIAQNVRRALSETFQASADTGQTLLDRIEELSARWRDWAESIQGQNQMEVFFRNSALIVQEVNGLIGDLFKALGQSIIENPGGIIAFIRTLRVEVVPAIISAIGSLAQLGPAVLSLVTAVAHLIEQMANSGALGTFTTGLLVMFNAIRSLLELPIVGDVLAWTLAFRAFGVAVNLISFGGFAKALGAVGTAMGGLVARMAATRVAVLGFSSTLGAIGAAAAGPIGIALAGLTLGLGFLATRHEEAKQKAAEQEAELRTLAGSLDQTTGAVTRATEAAITEALANEGLLNAGRELGIQRQVIIDAILGQEEAQNRLTDAMDRSAEAVATDVWEENRSQLEYYHVSLETLTAAANGNEEAMRRLEGANFSARGELDHVVEAVKGAGDQHSALRGFVESSSQAFDDERESIRLANEEMGNTAQAQALSDAIETLRDAAADADDKINAFKDSLAILNGEEVSTEQATRRMYQSFRDADDALVNSTASAQAGTTVYYDLSGAINQTTGELDTTTEIGGILADTYDDLFSKAEDTAAAIAASGGSAAEVRAPFATMNQQFRDLLTTAGATPEQIELITGSLNRVPSVTQLELLLQDNATDALDTANTLIDYTDGRTAIASLFADDTQLADRILAARGDLDELDQVIATATADLDPTEAQVVYQQVMAILTNLDSQTPTPQASLDPRLLERERQMVVENLDRLAAMRPTPEVRAETSYWQQKKREVDSDIAALNAARGIPTIDANTTPFVGKDRFTHRLLEDLDSSSATPTADLNDRASGGLSNIIALLRRIVSKTVTVTTVHKAVGGTVAKQAKGGIVKAANGLVREPMIAEAGSNILWAEPETHGEAYIPFAPSKRSRSKMLLRKVANQFGMQVVPNVKAMADGGVTTISSADTSTSRELVTSSATVVNNTFNLDTAVAGDLAAAYAERVLTAQRREAAVRGRAWSG